ncbi:hypothetical protein HK405_012435 [Cladochytrium tenue]|nr:hypothetical protein HK405_012435 [Cladochytrium tenue]
MSTTSPAAAGLRLDISATTVAAAAHLAAEAVDTLPVDPFLPPAAAFPPPSPVDSGVTEVESLFDDAAEEPALPAVAVNEADALAPPLLRQQAPQGQEQQQRRQQQQPTDGSFPVPDPVTYAIDAASGFLGAAEPLRRLPDLYYAPWELALDDLQGLMLMGSSALRRRIAAMPLLDHSRLESDDQRRRAYVVLSLIAQAYIWGGVGQDEGPEQILPACVAVPWCAICIVLDLKPVVSYAAVVLYNYKRLFDDAPMSLDNLAVLHTFSGTHDEAWFYLISLAMEVAGAPTVPLIADAVAAVRDADVRRLTDDLEGILACLRDMNTAFVRMYDKNDAQIFYSRVRPYFRGWVNTEQLPDGVLYEGVVPVGGVPNGPPSVPPLPPGTFGKYAGASAGQSPIMHVLDAALGIRHRPMVSRHGHHALRPGGTGTTHGSDVRQVDPQHAADIDVTAVAPPRTWMQAVSAALRAIPVARLMPTSTMTDSVASRSSHRQHPTPDDAAPPPSLLSAVARPASPAVVQAAAVVASGPHTGPLNTHPHAGHHHAHSQHHAVPTTASAVAPAFNAMLDMRSYMPGPAQRFIRDLELSYSVRAFVAGLAAVSGPSAGATDGDNDGDDDNHIDGAANVTVAARHESLRLGSAAAAGVDADASRACIDAYNACVAAVKGFRDAHVRMVSRYIVSQSGRAAAAAAATPRAGQHDPRPQTGGSGTGSGDSGALRGTGGTDLIPFLKQTRDETAAASIRISDSA